MLAMRLRSLVAVLLTGLAVAMEACAAPNTRMTIELTKEDRAQAIASIERYFREHMDEPIGNMAAGSLLGFFLEEIGPSIYNKAISDAQQRLQARVADLDFEVHEDEYSYWAKHDKKRKAKP